MGTGTVKRKNTNHTEETGIRVVRRRILQEDPQGDRLSSASFWWMTGLCFLSAVALCMLFTKAFSITFAKWLVYPAMLVYCDQETRERIFSVDHISCVTGCSAKWGKCIESSSFSITP